MFLLKHQDRDVEYLFERGGFAVEDEELYLSIETKAAKDGEFPGQFLLALRLYPFDANQKQLEFELVTNSETEFPEAFVYTTFHSQAVEAKVSVAFMSNKEASIKVSVVSDDVDYYDDRAKPNLFTGNVQLLKMPKEKLWLPS